MPVPGRTASACSAPAAAARGCSTPARQPPVRQQAAAQQAPAAAAGRRPAAAQQAPAAAAGSRPVAAHGRRLLRQAGDRRRLNRRRRPRALRRGHNRIGRRLWQVIDRRKFDRGRSRGAGSVRRWQAVGRRRFDHRRRGWRRNWLVRQAVGWRRFDNRRWRRLRGRNGDGGGGLRNQGQKGRRAIMCRLHFIQLATEGELRDVLENVSPFWYLSTL